MDIITFYNRGYQTADEEIIDYEFWELPGIDGSCRGPKVDLERPYFSCIGAAQTFGRFVQEPYPTLLARALGAQALNLGFSGVGPSFFLGRPKFFDFINNGKFCIVQMLSGRSISNSVFEVSPANQGLSRRKDVNARQNDRFILAQYAYEEYLRTASQEELHALREEIRQRYVELMKELLAKIKIPKVLLYFSRRAPNYAEGFSTIHAYWGDLPHFVNGAVVATLKAEADAYIEVVSARGLPQPLFSRYTGKPVLIWNETQFPKIKFRHHNQYYPSPEMHQDAANTLAKELADNSALVGGRISTSREEKTTAQQQEPRAHGINIPHGSAKPAEGALPRLCFIHIPKCSGNSVLDYLFNLYGRNSTFLGKNHIPFDYEYCAQEPSALTKYRLYPGHIHWNTVVTRLPRDTAKFTLLREPVDRLLSLYFFWRGMKEAVARTFGNEAYEAVLLTKKLDVMDWLQCDNHFIRNGRTNAYARYLVSGPVLQRGNLDEIVEEGRRNLETCIHAGTVENAEVNLAILCTKLGAPKAATLSWLNASKRSRVSPHERARIHAYICDLSPIDFLLYDHARKLESQALKSFILDKEGV